MRSRLLALALLSAATSVGLPSQSDVRVIVVVNAANPTSELPRDRVSQIFLRQLSTWTNGQEILPVDQIEKSPTRITFARDIERQTVSAMRRYWQERIFSGNEAPPPERVTDADVLTYIRSNAGAIGYVREGTDLGAGVKAVVVTDLSNSGSAVGSHS